LNNQFSKKLVNKFIPIISLFFLSIGSFGQKKNENYKYHIGKTNLPIKIDGIIEEEAWNKAELASDFHMMLPMDTSMANIKTKVKMTYDDKFIYISADNFIPHKKYIVESLRRDWNFGKNDNFLLIMDTFNDQTNGFAFGLNAAGAQWDGQQYEGGPVNLSWDNKWYSAVKQFEDHWSFEAAIPFKSIRFNNELETWGINFGRMDLPSTEKSSWAPVPRQFPSISSAFTGQLVWDKVPAKTGSNISLIPYFLGGTTKDFEHKKGPNYRKDIGFDAKIALGSSLNLDMTVNPDFSQVEVDRQVTNLDRFELFFPERRQFFLENDDLFNNIGLDRIRPFFSRRIGLGVPINYGARLSGKLNKNLRIGVMDIKTDGVAATKTDAQNFAVVTMQQKIFSRSNVTAFFINKDALNTENSSAPNINAFKSFNRNLGLEYNLASQNNLWRGKFMYYKSFSPNVAADNSTLAGLMTYNNRHWSINAQYENVGANYAAEVGYFQRKNYARISPRVAYLFLPKAGKVLTHGPSVFNFTFYDQAKYNVENTTGIQYSIELRTKAVITAYFANDFIELLSDFDPTNLTGIKIPKGSKHSWNSTGVFITSKPQSLFTYSFESRIGGYYSSGYRTRYAGTIGYRFQPYVQLALAAEVNDINLPEEKGLKDAHFWLISPRVDITLTNNFYFTTFVQYNEQLKNTNINARLQWRYKPVSDIFLVYTDNYATINPTVKNRAIVLKMTYWWNL
jgi:Domain of unknown function (DUF5916)/Carbohydrate family 9 binding domain-like